MERLSWSLAYGVIGLPVSQWTLVIVVELIVLVILATDLPGGNRGRKKDFTRAI